jgi:hypothetical protein
MSETDDQTPRRPPTIELAATEVDDAADEPATGDADKRTAGAAEHPSAGANAPGPAPSGRRFTSHIASAVIGAAVTAGAAAGLWFAGVIPSRETAPAGTATSETTAPAAPSNPAPSPPPPPAAAQNGAGAPDLTGRLDKIERAIEAQRNDPALSNRIADVAAQTKMLADNFAALTRRVDETAATSQSAGKQAETALKAAAAAKSAAEAASKDQVRREDVDALANRIVALESVVKGLAAATAPLTSSGVDDRTARLTIAAEALRAAVERGAPYQSELSAVKALGVDAKKTEALEPFAASGIPTAAMLARELEALAPVLQDVSEPHSGDTTFVERLKSNAQKLVRITPLNAPAGNDPQAVVDRIRLHAAHADIGAALADINALPDAAKPLAAAFTKKAAAREAALAASRQIAAEALAALAPSSNR